MTRADKILIGSILMIVLVFFMVGEFKKNNSSASHLAVIRIEGEVYQKISMDLDKNTYYEFKGPLGISKARLKDGKIEMLESPCKDKICIEQGQISSGGQSIVCVPNQISISIEDEEEDELDEISR